MFGVSQTMTALTFDYCPARLAPSIYWRRRVAALLVLAAVVLALATTAAWLGREPHIASEPTSQRVQLIERRVHVVAAGDSLWTIARSVQPTGDVRPLVQELADRRHGAPLEVGEKIVVPSAREVLVGQR